MNEFNMFRNGEIRMPPRHFDAIVLDLNMPIMNGFEACLQIMRIYDQFNRIIR